ncbi:MULTISPECIES: hypothetical protein [unclassified Moorena]|uniref:hypothetical protein n=1 Tax=unclassified Moorena TaxID=2683338 RepID=UPI0013C78942|nr:MULTISPECIES: hypothetical protein [unclassified Moorena]NEO21987.1 hypothetical protein [Moorena sp. SIO4A5]NEQ61325.1 hypothetical protein [Moorena sp. SIO4A1]
MVCKLSAYALRARYANSYSKGNREQGAGSREQGTNILSIDLGLLYSATRY